MTPHDPYSALRLASYRRYFIGNALASLGIQMQTMAVQWEVYERTGSELALGLVGLVQFVPVILLALLAGHVADHFSRRWIVVVAMCVVMCASTSLAVISLTRADYRWMYLSLLLVGIARAFQQPAKHALLPRIVPVSHFANAVNWNSTGFHMASMLGPALAGLLLAQLGSATYVYMVDAMFAGCFAAAVWSLREGPSTSQPEGPLRDLAAGIRFVRRQPVILGAISLDMFAVLLGGTIMLLPVYAEDILHVSPMGLGWMRAAPAIGALLMAVLIAHRPPIRRAGRSMLLAVAGFGAATIIFGISTSFWLSLAMLFLTGALDHISVVIRHTLVQTLTPDALRGRVSAINSLFIGASNELGGFESGLVAHWLGPVWSVVSGGVGTLLVVAWTSAAFPKLRRFGPLP